MANIILDQSTVPGDALDNHTVYIRQNWGNPWFDIPYLYCDWATWSVSGMQLNRAQLSWRYGVGMRPGEPDFAVVGRTWNPTTPRFFVRVDFGDPQVPWTWIGMSENIGDTLQGGSNPAEPAGEQKILCYGLEYLLEQHRIIDSDIQNVQDQRVTTGRGITFNNHGRGNRSAFTYSYANGQNAYIFGYDSDDASTDNSLTWSSLDIVKYLLGAQTPDGASAGGAVPWILDPSSEQFIPSYDGPELAQHGRRTLDLLDNIMARERFLTWWPEYDLTNDRMVVKAATFTDQDINVGSGTIKANPNVDTINIENDPAADNAVHSINHLDRVDQVIVQGARRTSTFTINNDADATAVKGWNATEEQLYNEGGSNSTDWPATNRILKKRKLNAEVRSSDELAKVYSEIKLPEAWDRLAGDGIGGEKNPVIPIDGNLTQSAELYTKEAYLSQNLALLKGRDYSSNNINQGTFKSHARQPQEPMKPFALAINKDMRDNVADPLNRRYLFTDRLGRISEYGNQDNGTFQTRFVQEEYSCRVRILPNSTRILLEVIGVDQQHVIAKGQFTGVTGPGNQAVDGYEGQPEWDWREWIFTVTMIEDRYAEGRHPADASIPPTSSNRRLVIDAGESYRRDYVVPNTVVGVDDNNRLLYSTSGGYLVDDLLKMEAVAKTAYEWYSTPRKTISFDTVFRSPADNFGLGRYVKTINSSSNQLAVDSIVTELKIVHSELSESQAPNNARVSLKTGFAEIDPQAFIATFG